ncbi:MAG TPA: NAD-dependent epimerase/dehydratase family protein [Jatrophihabitantaceae bacterium]|jgi:nucleoside-diphosphate-sugar epimerase
MRVVITGASGNLGTALLRRLRADGHELVGVSRRRPPPDVEPYSGVRWYPLDLGTADAGDQLADICSGADALVHLAWLIQPTHDRAQLRRANQGGAQAVARAASHVPHLVNVSSIGAYSRAPRGTWVDESWPAGGVASSSYSVDKVAVERTLEGVTDVVTHVRPTLVLQPDAASEIARYFLGPLVPVSLLNAKLFRFAPWPRELRLQFVHADDVAAAVAASLLVRPAGAVNLATDEVFDRAAIRRLFGGVGPPLPVGVVRAAATATWRARLQPIDGGWINLARSVPLLRSDRARTELDWTPKHSGDATLTEFIEALRQRRGHAGPLLSPRRLIGRAH